MEIISTTDGLAQVCEKAAESDFATIDTEFMRESTFWPILCLIQMAGPGWEVIIDTRANGIDLAPFYGLMADESVTKVFHAARQDIEIVHHQAKIIPHPIFDTQVAAMVCGFGDSVSYDNLVRKLLKRNIDKSSRFTDWARRPLTDKQLDYALGDVTHLRDVYAKLRRDLDNSGRLSWLDEEMSVLTSPSTYTLHPEDAWKRLKMRVKNRRGLAVMMEVASWREEEAQTRDIPRGRVLKDDAVYDIANQAPRNPVELARLRTIGKGFAQSGRGADLLKAIERGLERDTGDLPDIRRPPPLPGGTGALLDLMKVALKAAAEKHSVAVKLIANVDDLEKIVMDDAADVRALKGWRRKMFGETALALKQGRIALAAEDGKVIFVPRQDDDTSLENRSAAE